MHFAYCGWCLGGGFMEGRDADPLYYGFDTLILCRECGGKGGTWFSPCCESATYGGDQP
jgi:hypothetical protein